MTSREIILRNIAFDSPERIGFNFSGNRRNDFCGVGLSPSPMWKEKRWTEGNMEYYTDEWGNVWRRIVGKSERGEIYEPALKEWSILKDYKLPDMDNPERFKSAKEIFASNTELFRCGFLPGFPFSICRYLRKMEIYFEDLILYREEIDELHRQVTELLEKIIVGFANIGADGIFFFEDWGIQDRLLIDPSMWRDIYAPIYARLCNTAHEHGMKVLMHSCGYIWDIIDDLAEAGVDCFQFDQPRLYDMEKLAKKLKSLEVCLFSPVDIQKILSTGNRQKIVDEAKKMAELFRGGFIAKNYPDLNGIGVKEEWDMWAYEAFKEAGTL